MRVGQKRKLVEGHQVEMSRNIMKKKNKCLDSWQSSFERVGAQSNRNLSDLKQKEAVHFSRLFKCSQFAGDKVQFCRKEENEKYAGELSDTFSKL